MNAFPQTQLDPYAFPPSFFCSFPGSNLLFTTGVFTFHSSQAFNPIIFSVACYTKKTPDGNSLNLHNYIYKHNRHPGPNFLLRWSSSSHQMWSFHVCSETHLSHFFPTPYPSEYSLHLVSLTPYFSSPFPLAPKHYQVSAILNVFPIPVLLPDCYLDILCG